MLCVIGMRDNLYCLGSIAVLALIPCCASSSDKLEVAPRHSIEAHARSSSSQRSERTWIQGDAYFPEGAIAPSDAAWRTRVAFIYPSTGNSLEPGVQASRSHFRTRTSRVTADGSMSFAELLLAGRSADLEVMLGQKGLTAAFLKAPPANPADFNTIVEVCTYLDEEPQERKMGPLAMTIETVYFARILQPKAETRISSGRVQVKKAARKSNFSSWDVERYNGTLIMAQSEAQKRLVDWLEEHLTS